MVRVQLRGRPDVEGGPDELRGFARARSAEPRERRRPDAAARFAVLDADLARPRQADQLQPHADRRDGRDHAAERADRGRPDRRHAGEAGHRAAGDDHRIDAAAHARAVRQHPAEGQPGWLAGPPEGRRPRGAGFGELHVRHEVHGAADGRPRHPARDRRERAGDRERAAGQDRRAVEVLPARSRRALPVRHDAVRAPVDRGSGQDADRGHRAGVPRDVPVPAEPARDDHPDDRGAGRAARYVRDHGPRRFLDQHAVDVRPRARDRPAGRRCDRGGRERRARDGGRRAVTEGGDPQGDEPDHRRTRRRGARAVGGVRAGGVLRRLGRRDLSAVLADDRVGDGAVRAGRIGPDAGAVRDDPQADPAGASRREEGFLRLVQPDFRSQPRSLHERREPRDPALGPLARDLPRRVPRGRRDVRASAEVVPARRGSGLHVHDRADAVRLHAGNDRQDARQHQHVPDHRREGCGRLGVHGQRLQLRGPWPERGPRVREAETVRASPAFGPEGAGADRPDLRALFDVQGRDGDSVQPAVDSGTRYGCRLRLRADGQRRSRPRCADGRARPVARDGREGSGARAGAPERPERYAAVQGRHRPREGECARRDGRGDRPDVLDRMGVAVREQLPRHRRPDQEGVRTVGRAVPDDAGRHEHLVRAQQRGRDGAVQRILDRPLDLRFAEARALQRGVVDRNPGAGRGRQIDRPGDGRDGSAREQAAGRHRLLVDGPVVPGNPVRLAGADPVRDLDPRRLPVSRGAV